MAQCNYGFSGMEHDELVDYFSGLSRNDLLQISLVIDSSVKRLLSCSSEEVFFGPLYEVLDVWLHHSRLELSKRALRDYKDRALPHPD